jgi:hypothetical protein
MSEHVLAIPRRPHSRTWRRASVVVLASAVGMLSSCDGQSGFVEAAGASGRSLAGGAGTTAGHSMGGSGATAPHAGSGGGGAGSGGANECAGGQAGEPTAPTRDEIVAACSHYAALDDFLSATPCTPGERSHHGQKLEVDQRDGSGPAEAPLSDDTERVEACANIEPLPGDCWENNVFTLDCLANETWYCSPLGGWDSFHDCDGPPCPCTD